eukprot:scaffold36978_cov58-Attheya_sp.AAC.1
MLINVLVGSAALTVCVDRLARGVLQYTPTLNMVFVGLATLTDCVDRPYGGMWCRVVRVVSCRQPHLLFRRSRRPVRGGVGRGSIAIAFRL